MSRHPVDVLKAALQEAKTEAATLRIKTATLAEERNAAILERNEARARVTELEQQNAVQRENVDEAMRRSTRLAERVLELELFIADTGVTSAQEDAAKRLRDLRTENTRLVEWVRRARMQIADAKGSRTAEMRNLKLNEVMRQAESLAGLSRKERRERAEKSGCGCMDSACQTCFPASDNAPFRQLEPDALTRIRELEAEVQRLQQDRAQVGAFGFKPLGIR